MKAAGNILQRVRELAVQSANASNSPGDRQAPAAGSHPTRLRARPHLANHRIQRHQLLDGTFGTQQFQVGANANQTIMAATANLRTNQYGNNQVVGSGADAQAASTNAAAFGTNGAQPCRARSRPAGRPARADCPRPGAQQRLCRHPGRRRCRQHHQPRRPGPTARHAQIPVAGAPAGPACQHALRRLCHARLRPGHAARVRQPRPDLRTRGPGPRLLAHGWRVSPPAFAAANSSTTASATTSSPPGR